MTRLFDSLKKKYPELCLFLFERPDRQIGYSIIGKHHTDSVLEKSLHRNTITYNPISHLRAIIKILSHSKHAKAIIHECKTNGLTLAQIYGQLFYYNKLLGRKFELVHINALQTAYHFKAKSWFRGAKVLVSSRGQDFDFFPDKYDLALTNADHVHVLGNYLQRKVIDRGVPAERITIIPPAFPGNILNASCKHLAKGTINIATAARLEWTKGYRYSIRAIKLLVDRGINVIYNIYGDGSQREELLYLIKYLNLTDRVILHGWTNENVLIPALKANDLYLLLSIEEAFNNSVLLAQSLGLPCVVSRTGGLPENVVHENSGLVVERYDSQSAAKAIEDLISDPEVYTRYSKNASERVIDFSIDRQVEAFTQLYEKLLTE